jgi:hypothetical protein
MHKNPQELDYLFDDHGVIPAQPIRQPTSVRRSTPDKLIVPKETEKGLPRFQGGRAAAAAAACS